MSDKLSRLQSYSFKRPSGDVKFIKLKEENIKKNNIDAKIASIKRDANIKFTGRENEISELKRAYFSQKKQLSHFKELKNKFSQDIKPPAPLVIGIKGEAGLGKSRLVSEFLRSNAKKYLMGVSDNSAQNSYSLFVSFIKTYCGISNSDSENEMKNKLKFAINDMSNYEKSKADKNNLENSFNLICYLLSINSKDYRLKLPASELKVHLQLSIKYFIEAAAAKVNFSNEPLIVVCEDIHWIDDSSRNTLSYLFNTLNVNKISPEQYRMMIFLLLYRPEFKITKDAELKTDFTEIELDPLDYNSVQRILSSKSENRKGNESLKLISDETVKLLAERSEGNPLFIQEWIKMYGEKYSNEKLDKIKKSKLRFEKEKIEIPESINFLINKRLERLTENELHILQYASVIGNEFSDVLLKKITALLAAKGDNETILIKLIENRFIKKSDKAFGNEKYFEFHHDVIRKVIYDTVSEDNRKILHKTTGEAIEDLFRIKIKQYYYILCEHFEKGGAKEKTMEYLEKSGDRAKESFENERAVEYYGRLENFIDPLNYVKFVSIVLRKIEVLKIIGKWGEAIKICKSILSVYEIRSNKELSFQVTIQSADIFLNQSKYSQSIQLLRRLYRNFYNSKDDSKLLEILGLMCMNYLESGAADKAEEFSLNYFNLAHLKNDKLNMARAYDTLGLIDRLRGNFKSSTGHLIKSLKLYEEVGDLVRKAILTNRIGINYSYLSEYSKAIQYFENCIKLTEKNGDIREYANAVGNLGIIYDSINKNHKAIRLIKKKLELSQQLNYAEGIAGSYASLGNFYKADNNYDESLNYYKKALEVYEQIDRKNSIANMNCNIALVHLDKGNFGEALKHFAIQRTIDERISNKEGIFRGYLNTGNLHKQMNNYNEAEKNFLKAIKLANYIDSKLLKAIANYNYADLLFNKKEFIKSAQHNSISMEIRGNENYESEVIEFELLDKKIKFEIEYEKITFDSQQNSLNCNSSVNQIINETENLLQKKVKEEQLGKIHFEIWKMKNRIGNNNRKAIQNKNLALKHFKSIFKKTKNTEFQKYIFEITASNKRILS